MNDFIGQYGIRYGELMASSVLVSVPVVAVFFLLLSPNALRAYERMRRQPWFCIRPVSTPNRRLCQPGSGASERLRIRPLEAHGPNFRWLKKERAQTRVRRDKRRQPFIYFRKLCNPRQEESLHSEKRLVPMEMAPQVLGIAQNGFGYGTPLSDLAAIGYNRSAMGSNDTSSHLLGRPRGRLRGSRGDPSRVQNALVGLPAHHWR
jgi:hypothetical protein